MSKKILVTGGAGYIGSHTIVELIEKTGYEIISVDNFSNSAPLTFDRIEQVTGKRVRNYEVDLCSIEETEAFFQQEKDIAGVIHFAAFKSVPESVANPHKYYHNNISALLNLLEMCLKYQVNDFIFSSSCSVYGNIDEMPVSEDSQLGKAVSPYAYTKQIGEQVLVDYARVYPQLQVIALRYFNPAGAHRSALMGEDPINVPTSLVPVITKTAIGKIPQMAVYGSDYATRDGSCVRDYIHVCDIAEAHILALEYLFDGKNESNFDIFNLGTGQGITVLEAIASFEKVSGQKLNYVMGPRRDGDVEAIYSDTKKSKTMLGWEPRYSLDEIMDSTWKWENNVKNNEVH
ncbi:MAG: UDP-glucose-4-epimerase [Crocinitomicaceae bacterium]|jgi:UDP-glucose 4-epimerase|nr:UDP-glucose-4-epimerase [Crocinitomicaceae bacterium]